MPDVCTGICRVVRLSAERVSFEFSVKSESSYRPQKWIGFYASSVGWSGWVKQSTAEPPQEYDLPLAEGITTTQRCVYHKNQFSEVSVRGIASGNIVNGVLIATLPVGFRPAYTLEYPATFAADGDRPAGTISVGTDGTIRAQVVSSSFAVIFSASFIALS